MSTKEIKLKAPPEHLHTALDYARHYQKHHADRIGRREGLVFTHQTGLYHVYQVQTAFVCEQLPENR